MDDGTSTPPGQQPDYLVLICIALAVAVAVGDDSYISYGALGRHGSPCDPLRDPQGCLPPPANPYNRGCSVVDRCRGNGQDVKQDLFDEIGPVEGEPELRKRKKIDFSSSP
ncbi:hypothetical protein AgCh_003999 [Apium graveolens]